MKIDGRGKITLSTGKELYANCGIIGIAPDLAVAGGYDGGIFDFAEHCIPAEIEGDFTEEERLVMADKMVAQLGEHANAFENVDDYLILSERIELADHMIATWERFKKLGTKTREDYCEN